MSVRISGWISLALVAIVGCGRATKSDPSLEVDTTPITTTVATPPVMEAEHTLRKESPAIRRRSPESLRQRIRDTVARMQADAEPRRHRQALQRVAEAILKYQQQHGAMPADSVHLSWRVSILPFLGEERLFREFHQNEPWNSAHNEPLIARMPKAFGDDPLGFTRCVLADSGPVMVMEGVEDDEVFWTKPREASEPVAAVPRRIALRDGTVAELGVAVSPAAWAEWSHNAPASNPLPKWVQRFPSQTAVREFGIEAAEEMLRPRFVLPKDTFCLIHTQPQRLMRNPHLQNIAQHLVTAPATPVRPTILDSVLGPYRAQLQASTQWMSAHGIAPLRLQTHTIVVPASVWSGPVTIAELFAMVCHAPGAFDVEGLITYEMELDPAYQYREQGSSAGIIQPQRSVAWHFQNETTLLYGGQQLVAHLSEAQPGDSRLTRVWEAAGDAPVMAVIDFTPLVPLLERQLPTLPGDLQQAIPSLRDATELVISCDPDARLWFTTTLTFREARAAENVFQILEPIIEDRRAKMTERSPSTSTSARSAWWTAIAQGLKCDCEGNRLRITVVRPEQWEALLQLLLAPDQQNS